MNAIYGKPSTFPIGVKNKPTKCTWLQMAHMVHLTIED